MDKFNKHMLVALIVFLLTSLFVTDGASVLFLIILVDRMISRDIETLKSVGWSFVAYVLMSLGVGLIQMLVRML